MDVYVYAQQTDFLLLTKVRMELLPNYAEQSVKNVNPNHRRCACLLRG